MECITSFSGDYRWLSNFHPIQLNIKGIQYNSVEHFYQAMKFPESKWGWIGQCDKPKKRGNLVKLPEFWDKHKVDYMWLGLNMKFQDPELRQMLVDTGDQFILEGNYWHDNFWGRCTCKQCWFNETGQNKLGELLMYIRDHTI